MKETFLFILLLFIVNLKIYSINNKNVLDSIAIETKNGEKYIVYKVNSSETLISIAKKYNVTVNNIMAANPSLNTLKVNQVISIPIIKNTEYYRIKPRDNLFRIARKTGMTVVQLKELNNIENQYISPGQVILVEKEIKINKKLETNKTESEDSLSNSNDPIIKSVKIPVFHIVEDGEGLYRISINNNITIDSLIRLNKLDKNRSLIKGQKLIVGYQKLILSKYKIADFNDRQNNAFENIALDTLKSAVIDIKNTTINFHEKGSGEKVKANNIDNKTKKTAFHKTIPIGTFIRVTNPSNRVSTVVRVIARIPDTDRNKKLIIKLSQATCDTLGLVNDKFPIEIAYHLSNY